MINTTQYMKRVPFGTMLLLLLALLSACRVTPPGKIDLLTVEADYGTILNTNSMTKIFEVRNSGDGPLTITRLSTSCSCTTATLSQETLEPGEVANLEVTFDPTEHNGATGQFMRQIFIESTDPETPKAIFTIHVTVIKA